MSKSCNANNNLCTDVNITAVTALRQFTYLTAKIAAITPCNKCASYHLIINNHLRTTYIVAFYTVLSYDTALDKTPLNKTDYFDK